MLKVTPPLADFAIDHLRKNRPDVVVYDAIAFWGVIARRTLKLPAVSDSPIFVPELIRHMVSWRELVWYGRESRQAPAKPRLELGVDRLALRRQPAAAVPALHADARRRQRHPVEPRGTSRSRRCSTTREWVFVGGTMDPETRPEPFDFSRLDGRPLVLVSLGTIQFTNDAFFRMVMETFADFPAQFVLAAGPGSDPARLGTPPENFIVVPTYPQLPLLERAAAFITHGGLGSIHEGLWHGVPMVARAATFRAVAQCPGGAGGGPHPRRPLLRPRRRPVRNFVRPSRRSWSTRAIAPRRSAWARPCAPVAAVRGGCRCNRDGSPSARSARVHRGPAYAPPPTKCERYRTINQPDAIRLNRQDPITARRSIVRLQTSQPAQNDQDLFPLRPVFPHARPDVRGLRVGARPVSDRYNSYLLSKSANPRTA